MKTFLKKKINLILLKLGWKLIKLRKVPEPNPYGKLDLEILKAINDSKGIIHLGAHRGTEAEIYNWFGKKVIWVEALPKTYEHLKDNLYFYKNQQAYCALLSDSDNKVEKFNISNHDAACSSIFNFTDEVTKSKVWANRKHRMLKTINLKTLKFDTLIKRNDINIKNYNHWILDLQGAELLALRGSEKSLEFCKSIVVEINQKNIYSGGVLWDELKNWLLTKGFYPTREPKNDEDDILFLKK